MWPRLLDVTAAKHAVLVPFGMVGRQIGVIYADRNGKVLAGVLASGEALCPADGAWRSASRLMGSQAPSIRVASHT